VVLCRTVRHIVSERKYLQATCIPPFGILLNGQKTVYHPEICDETVYIDQYATFRISRVLSYNVFRGRLLLVDNGFG
jgi:hypothetical protein